MLSPCFAVSLTAGTQSRPGRSPSGLPARLGGGKLPGKVVEDLQAVVVEDHLAHGKAQVLQLLAQAGGGVVACLQENQVAALQVRGDLGKVPKVPGEEHFLPLGLQEVAVAQKGQAGGGGPQVVVVERGEADPILIVAKAVPDLVGVQVEVRLVVALAARSMAMTPSNTARSGRWT